MIPKEQKPLVGKPTRTYNRSDIIASTGEVDMLLISFRNEEIVAPVVMTDITTGEFTADFVRDGETYTVRCALQFTHNPSGYIVHTYADHGDLVLELNENNNERSESMLNCPTPL